MNRTWLALFVAVVGLASSAVLAQPLTTAFTFQAEVGQSGAPAAGPIDLRFRLYDSLAGPGQIGLQITAANVPLIAGRFAVSLDFGAAAFTGNRRWIEIDVRPAGAGTYTTLTPRRELTATPNALFAATSGQATNATALNGQLPAFYQSATNLTGGTLADLRLSTNVALLNTPQTISSLKTFSTAPLFSSATSPFTVTSQTLVTNLNADLLDGQHGSFYLDAGNLTNTLLDARLSSNVVLLAGAQTFSGAKTFSTAPAFTAAGSPFTVSNTTKVTGLNADLLDGLDGSSFLRTSTPINLAASLSGLGVIRATNLDVTTFDSSAIRGDVYGTTGINGVGVIGYKGPSGASHTMIGGGAGVVGYADSGFGVAGVLFGTGAGTAIYGYAGSSNASAGLFQGRVAVNGDFDVNFASKSLQFRMDGGLVPGINLSGTGANLGVLRLRNALEIWPNDAGTAPGRFDVRDSTGAARVILEGDTGRVVASGSLDVDEWGQNNGTFGPGVLRLGGSGSGEGIASNRTSDANGNRYGLDFYTGGGTRRLSITVDGKVGIGTASPNTLLQVGDGSDAAISIPPGAAMNSVPYTSPNTPDVPKQTFVAPESIGIASIELHISNAAAAARSTAITISGPGVNTLSNTVSLPPTGGAPVTLIFSSFLTPPVLTAGGIYTINFVGGPIDGLVRTYFRTDDPYAAGAASGLGIPAGADLVCTIRLVGSSSAPGLTVTQDGKVGIRSTFPTAPLTVGGDAIVLGTLAKGGGSFRIDHPLDPANKFLYHSFVESPDMKNIYDGTTTTDADGFATITLPDWFSALNRDFRYQLTVIDEDDTAEVILWAKVIRKIGSQAPNQFSIRTARGGLEVSWQVTGIRKDAFAEKNRIPLEVDKNASEKGRYLHPQAFGMSEQMGIYTSTTRAPAAP